MSQLLGGDVCGWGVGGLEVSIAWIYTARRGGVGEEGGCMSAG